MSIGTIAGKIFLTIIAISPVMAVLSYSVTDGYKPDFFILQFMMLMGSALVWIWCD